MKLDNSKVIMFAVKKGLKQTDLMQASNLSRSTISAIYCGRSCSQECEDNA